MATIAFLKKLYIYIFKTYIFQKNICKNSGYVVTFALKFFRVAGYQKQSNKIPTPIQIYIGFVDAVLRPKILGNRLGILRQILIAMDYLFFDIFQRIIFNLKKQKHLLKKISGSPHTSNRICSLRKRLSNYLYPKDM